MTANEFKFRANSDWTINYGGDGVTENGLARNGANIKVPADAAYIITLDLTTAGKYTYAMEETTIELSSAFMTLWAADWLRTILSQLEVLPEPTAVLQLGRNDGTLSKN